MIARLIRTEGVAPPGGELGFNEPLARLIELPIGEGHAYDLTGYVSDQEAALDDFVVPMPAATMWFEWPSMSGMERRGCVASDLTDRLDGNDDSPFFDEPVWAAMEHARSEYAGEVTAVVHLMFFVESNDRAFGPVAWLVLVLGADGHIVGNRWYHYPGLTPEWVLANALPVLRYLHDRHARRLQIVGRPVDGLRPVRPAG